MITFSIRGDQVVLNPSISTNSSNQTATIESGYVWRTPEYEVRITATNPVGNQLGPQSGIVLVELIDITGDVVQVFRPMNAGQEANVQPDLSGLGDGYARFSTGALVDAETGQPWVGSIVLLGCGASGKDLPLEFPRGDGLFDLDKCSPPVNPCFISSAEILTSNGMITAGDLQTNDMVWTMDGGFQPIIGISRKSYTKQNLLDDPSLLPYKTVRSITKHSMFLSERRSLYLSKHHRVLLDDSLISVHHLSNMVHDTPITASVRHVNSYGDHHWLNGDGITYVNIFLPKHEIICVNGFYVESGYLGGDMAPYLSGLDWTKMQPYSKNHKPARPFINHKGKLL